MVAVLVLEDQGTKPRGHDALGAPSSVNLGAILKVSSSASMVSHFWGVKVRISLVAWLCAARGECEHVLRKRNKHCSTSSARTTADNNSNTSQYFSKHFCSQILNNSRVWFLWCLAWRSRYLRKHCQLFGTRDLLPSMRFGLSSGSQSTSASPRVFECHVDTHHAGCQRGCKKTIGSKKTCKTASASSMERRWKRLPIR